MNEIEVENQIIAIVILTIIVVMSTKQRAARRWWVHPLLTSRERHGFFITHFQYMLENDDEELFFKYTRMTLHQFNFLIQRARPYLLKRSRKKPLSPKERLMITL